MSDDLQQRFDALPLRSRRKILDRHVDINVSHHWWDSVEDNIRDDLRRAGFSMKDLGFSVSGCQGDGASFTGSVQDWAQFLPAIGYNSKPLLWIADDSWWLNVVRSSSMYVHENTVSIELDGWLPDDSDELSDVDRNNFPSHVANSDLLLAVWLLELRKYDLRAIEERCKEFLRDKMVETYKYLQEEYEYLTSDEQILEALIANEMLEELLDEEEALLDEA